MQQFAIENHTPSTDYALLPDTIICFSHLRWDFVYQRPQHLLSRLAATCAVYFIEEPIYDAHDPHYRYSAKGNNVTVAVPHLPTGLAADEEAIILQALVDGLITGRSISNFAAWYYTPMALKFSRHLQPAITIFDCMDELSAFKFAPQELKDLEAELLVKADLVFTGGRSLYNAKKDRHANIHCLPSSIDKAHFGQARQRPASPADQAQIPTPRLGFFGVIDERFDIQLINDISLLRPEWQIVLIGPVVKIDSAQLPVRDNIHYLGPKSYAELPVYLAGWNIAMIAFQLNESTKFISPTKTPEYLAAGIPVISTPIADVIQPYGEQGLVYIGADAQEFIAHAEAILNGKADAQWLKQVDDFLKEDSWDNTVSRIIHEIEITIETKAKS